jgi:hypothetical protein
MIARMRCDFSNILKELQNVASPLFHLICPNLWSSMHVDAPLGTHIASGKSHLGYGITVGDPKNGFIIACSTTIDPFVHSSAEAELLAMSPSYA